MKICTHQRPFGVGLPKLIFTPEHVSAYASNTAGHNSITKRIDTDNGFIIYFQLAIQGLMDN